MFLSSLLGQMTTEDVKGLGRGFGHVFFSVEELEAGIQNNAVILMKVQGFKYSRERVGGNENVTISWVGNG